MIRFQSETSAFNFFRRTVKEPRTFPAQYSVCSIESPTLPSGKTGSENLSIAQIIRPNFQIPGMALLA